MKINWKVRFKNKTWLIAFVGAIVAFVYQMLGAFGIVPSVSEDNVTQIVGLFINLLVGLGIVVDPTTQGIGDSNRALGYTEPNKDEESM